MDMYVGQIQAFAFGYAPRGWQVCQGQQLAISQFTALYSLIGTFYGGNGTSNFNLPDLRGRVPSCGPLNGNNIVVGAQTGTPTVTLDMSTMAAHPHNLIASTSPEGSVAKAATDVFATTGATNKSSGGKTGIVRYSTNARNTTLAAQSISFVGQGQPHDNMQPYIGLTYCICIMGVFPPRN